MIYWVVTKRAGNRVKSQALFLFSRIGGNMDSICKQVGARLRTLRRERGYTLAEFAQVVHRSKSTISKYERGEISVDIATLDELARALGVSVSAFFETRAAGMKLMDVAEEKPEDMERLYLYIYSAHEGKPWVAHCALFLGKNSAHIYAELPDDEEIYNYRSCYFGILRRTNSFTRVIAVNPMHDDDVIILNYELTLKPVMAYTCFACSLSIGQWYPLAMPALISTVPIKDEDWIKAQLRFTAKDMRAFRSINAFFHHTRSLEKVSDR